MNLDIILQSISELEETSREEEGKYIHERTKHRNTQTELEKALREVEQAKESQRSLYERVSSLETEKKAADKLIQQLEESFVNKKQEVQLLEEHQKKQRLEYEEKREFFVKTIDSLSARLRKVLQYNRNKVNGDAPDPFTSFINEEIIPEVSALQNEVVKMEQKLDVLDHAKEKLEAELTKAFQLEKSSNKPEPKQPNATCDHIQELGQLKQENQRLTDAYLQLEQYSQDVKSSYDELQAFCCQVICPKCELTFSLMGEEEEQNEE